MSIIVEIHLNIAEEVQHIQALLKGLTPSPLNKAMVAEINGHLLNIRDYAALAINELVPD